MLQISPPWQAHSDTTPQQERAHRTQLDALARAELLEIARYLFGTTRLPNDDRGRDFLRALLHKGMSATQAIEVAPWSRRDGELFDIIDEVAAERRIPNADRLGEMIEFSFDDLKALKWSHNISIRHVAPYDAQACEVEDFWEDERREADRLRKRQTRKQSREEGMPAGLTMRARIVRKAMDREGTSVSIIMGAVANLLRDQRNRRLRRHALQVAVHRALDELIACGLAEDKIEISRRGSAIRFARLTDAGSHVTRVMRHKILSAHVATQ